MLPALNLFIGGVKPAVKTLEVGGGKRNRTAGL